MHHELLQFKVYDSMLVSIFAELYNLHHHLILEHLHHSRKKSHACQSSLFLPAPSPKQPLVYFVSP